MKESFIRNIDVPRCDVDGCNKPRMWNGTYKKDGSKQYKRNCSMHNSARWITKYVQEKKTYCENIDGRLGYKCTTTIVSSCQLEVDHVDGNPSNNKSQNLQTLCGCCHSYKTNIMRDGSTPGRKTLGVS